ncbi:hypothetical protein A3K92_01430 [Thermococcus gorgonarius]|uniref:Uncharacterized protein n=1 Tax=Thermococcus gorgonarius TaxID=71997 RepID=A0A2Z2M778_THEGO|nr:hypothetical protein A3K92_01430 [Thermococcus gorgonarius]
MFPSAVNKLMYSQLTQKDIHGYLSVSLMYTKKIFHKILNQVSRKRKAVLEKYKKDPTVMVVYVRNRHKYQINTLEEHGIHVLVLEPLLKKLLESKDLDTLKEILKE